MSLLKRYTYTSAATLMLAVLAAMTLVMHRNLPYNYGFTGTSTSWLWAAIMAAFSLATFAGLAGLIALTWMGARSWRRGHGFNVQTWALFACAALALACGVFVLSAFRS